MLWSKAASLSSTGQVDVLWTKRERQHTYEWKGVAVLRALRTNGSLAACLAACGKGRVRKRDLYGPVKSTCLMCVCAPTTKCKSYHSTHVAVMTIMLITRMAQRSEKYAILYLLTVSTYNISKSNDGNSYSNFATCTPGELVGNLSPPRRSRIRYPPSYRQTGLRPSCSSIDLQCSCPARCR